MSNHGPTHRVYTLIPRKDAEGQDDTFWLNIGAAFPHKDAKGFNLVLRAMPLDGDVPKNAAVRAEVQNRSGLGQCPIHLASAGTLRLPSAADVGATTRMPFYSTSPNPTCPGAIGVPAA